MNLVSLIILTLILMCQAEEIHQTKEAIKNTQETLNGPKNFRKALLDALEQLEKDEIQNNKRNNNFNKDELDASDYDEDERTKYGHKIRDNVSKQEATVTSFTDTGKASVFVHSFSTNSQNRFMKDKKITGDFSTINNQLKETPDNIISASLTSAIPGRGKQLTSTSNQKEVSKIFSTTPAPVTQKIILSSPNPTVSTPVEDETKAKVEDVQFIHAPLVAAFTVEQDDKGLPQKVIPIYGNKLSAHNNQFTAQASVQNIVQPSLEERQRQLEQQILILQEQKRRLNIKNDINLLSHSLQKQNDVNNQLLQQNRLDNFQHALNPHLGLQKNTLNNMNDGKILQSQNLSTQSQIFSNIQNRFNIQIPSFNNDNSFASRPTKDLTNTVVSFQPSISFQPNSFNSNNPFTNQNSQIHQIRHHQQLNPQQTLPIKAAVNFQKAITLPVNQPDNSLTEQQVPNQFRNQVFNNNNDNYLQNFLYSQRTLVPSPPRGNRVFRQETQVGNFGLNDFIQHKQKFHQSINNNFNNNNIYNQNLRYSSFNGIQNNLNSNNNKLISNQFFTTPNVHNNADNKLQNLLYNSGVGQGSSQEDLNIVSKVLALDHTGNYYQNFHFGALDVSNKNFFQ